MDFPKSVPGVGLVGGQFADEDASIGRQGSLIPAVWGNAVTLEILGVIEAAGLEPSEAETGQLLEAVRALVPERSAFTRVSGTVTLPASVFGIYALADGGAAATVTLPSTADLFDDTELLLFANHANTAAMQVKAAAGQTVQGPAALMGASTAAFMLPAGGDWVRLRSEKAQGRWVVVSSYANARMDMIDARVSALESGSSSITKNGFKIHPDGEIEQWGVLENVNLGSVIHTVTYPIPFPKQVFNPSVTFAVNGAVDGSTTPVVIRTAFGLSTMQVVGDGNSLVATLMGDIYWRVKGK